jgi:hypothetical protein
MPMYRLSSAQVDVSVSGGELATRNLPSTQTHRNLFHLISFHHLFVGFPYETIFSSIRSDLIPGILLDEGVGADIPCPSA